MERKRIEKIVALLLVGILMPVSLFPFHIHADTLLLGDIQGMQLELIDTSVLDATGTYPRSIYTYRIVVKLRDNYLGYARMSIPYSYYSNNGQTNEVIQGTTIPTFYFNGDSSSATFTITAKYLNDPIIDSTPQYSIESSNVVKISEIDNIQQIIDILQEVYQNSDDIEGLQTNMLSELQSVVANTSLSNDYLDIISQLRQWHVPFESYSAVTSAIMNNLELIGESYKYQYFDYPIYKVYTGDTYIKFRSGNNVQFTYIFFSSLNMSVNNIQTLLSFSGNCTINEVNKLNNGMIYMDTGNGYLYKVLFTTESASYFTISHAYSNSGTYIPIYIGQSNNKYISTDFALQFGLSNNLLDNIQIIANGTSQSSSASGSLDQTTSQFSDDANDLVTIEESFNNSMNQSLQSVNPTFNMGSSFLTSANWVSQQFNRIVNNTPFASLITFGLTLGLGLLIIGKVRK